MHATLYTGYQQLQLCRRTRGGAGSSRSGRPLQQWKDDVWPFREQEAWDISTDYPHTRKLSYEVSEGTWLRLDVHPTSGEIVFDMLGDLYCLAPPSTTAHVITRGVPHDSDAHFSPRGDMLAFRSDAGLGLDNIWVMPWRGCASMGLEQGGQWEPHGRENQGVDPGPETPRERARRLIAEGRAGAVRVTNETYRYVSDARWHPSGDRVIASKWYTGRITLAGGEGWEYPIPPASQWESWRVERGAGRRLVERNLPAGWPAEDYNLNPIGPEQFIWAGDDALIYAMNTADDQGVYHDSKDVHKGIYAIFHRNLTTGYTRTLVPASSGGASRPELSRDGKTLAFVRRVRDKEALVFMDLRSGTLTNIWYGLTYDLQVVGAPGGTYPSFAWTPADDAVIIWAAGRIWRIPVAPNHLGERVGGGQPTQVPFTVRVEKLLAETLRPQTDLLQVETAQKQRVHAMKELDADPRGERVVFSAAGSTYIYSMRDERAEPQALPVRDAAAAYYAPSFSAAGDRVVHVRWSNTNFSTLEVVSLRDKRTFELAGLPWPLGRYHNPALCACGRHVAFVRMPGEVGSGFVVATGHPGIYVASFDLSSAQDGLVSLKDVVRVSEDAFDPGSPQTQPLRLRFTSCQTLLVQTRYRALTIALSPSPGPIAHAQSVVASAKMSEQLAVALPGAYVAFVERMHVYVAPVQDGAWAHPRSTTRDLARVSDAGGHDIVFSNDGQRLFWLSGPVLHSLDMSRLGGCLAAIRADATTRRLHCTQELVERRELVVEYDAEAARLRRDAGEEDNADVLVLVNATLVTMETGAIDADVIRDGAIVMQGGTIRQVGKRAEVHIPSGAQVIDVDGGHVLPGFLDVHAHWARSFTYPVSNFMYAAMLAYGVTTVHNPSHSSVGGFYERFLLEKGHSIGPRIYQTGEPLFGAEGWPELHQEIVDMREAWEALSRIRAEGGPVSFSYKNYQLPSRAARQRLLLQARNLSMLCVPEGGMNFDWSISYIIDGMTSVEHAMVPSVLYDDVLTLWSKSGTSTTPTHVVGYGGAFGEEQVWSTRNVAEDEKIRRFIAHSSLEALQEGTSRPYYSYAYHNTSRITAELIRRGTLASVGAHGEPPLGLNFHSELRFFLDGGLSPYEVLRSATRMPAQALGVFAALGSLSVGKLADVVVYAPDVDILAGLDRSEDLRYVVRGGRVWRADTLEEVWPVQGRRLVLPPINAD
ncbi:hypothetical protein AURDEDRAFT_145360 [Auricularia subglabra TFB-10046 SS5]|nr:hypothetical protein AURDEDRAFT_145360 [Auricularia subglabra TFB-10046 SS5]